MLDNFKKILNEDQDPKAVEKISEKLQDILMRNEEVGYIAVQKKPAITVFPDSIIMTNKRIIIFKPKNLGLSMDITDYDWDDIVIPFVKENILGAEFSFMTKNDLTLTIDYLPKNQAKKLYTFAKEQLDDRKNVLAKSIESIAEAVRTEEPVLAEEIEEIEVVETEEVNSFAEIVPREIQPAIESAEVIAELQEIVEENKNTEKQEKTLADFTKEELFEKLQSYKKLLDNGLILQGEYDALKNEVLKHI
ncbi:PH domain-containing protein [Paenimyroides ceti]